MPRKAKPSPLATLFIQGLSDHRTIKPEVQTQAAEFVDDFTGEVMPTKVVPSDDKPEYVRTAPVRRNVSKHQEAKAKQDALQRTVNTLDTLVRAMIDPSLVRKVLPKPKHNEVHTESKLVITVPRRPGAIKRRF